MAQQEVNNLKTAVTYYRQTMLAKEHLKRCQKILNLAVANLSTEEFQEYRQRTSEIDAKAKKSRQNNSEEELISSVEQFQQSVRSAEAKRAEKSGHATISQLKVAKRSK